LEDNSSIVRPSPDTAPAEAADQPSGEAVPAPSSWVSEITPKKPLLHLPLAEIWRYRDLIFLTVWRDFISVHKQTIFGPLWYFAQPLVSTVVYQIVFGKIAQLPTNNIPPFLFYMSGIVIWYYFSGCLSRTSTTFSANAGLFTKVYFPRLTIPIAQCISNIWQFLIQLVIFLGFYLYFLLKGAPIHPSYRIVIIPFLILQTALLGLGVGCLISALSTRFRDLQVAVAPAIQLWMYASCIFYPRAMVPENLQWLMTLNPIVPIIEGFRFALMGHGQVEIYQWLASLAVTSILLIIGLVEFGRAEKTFADTI
jgi:lipopolysaccharide transport system permease protein